MKKLLFIVFIISSLYADINYIPQDDIMVKENNYFLDISHRNDKEFINSYFKVKENEHGNLEIIFGDKDLKAILESPEKNFTMYLTTKFKVPEQFIKTKEKVLVRINFEKQENKINYINGYNVPNSDYKFKMQGYKKDRLYAMRRNGGQLGIFTEYNLKEEYILLTQRFIIDNNIKDRLTRIIRPIRIEFAFKKYKRGKRREWFNSNWEKEIKIKNKKKE